MARSLLTNPQDDLIQDSGAVLWSFIKGEQLEFPVTLSFITGVASLYTYEAVVIEALNVDGSLDVPVDIKPGGVQTILSVRVPTYRGNWDGVQAYNTEEVVKYGSLYYRLSEGVARVSATTPALDSTWIETQANVIYLQFSKTLGTTWTVQPKVGIPSYGFFELRVTEPSGGFFQKTWKPVRGMVKILFSPTEAVADV